MRTLSTLIAAAGTLAVACGGGAPGTAGTGNEGRQIDVVMQNYAFTPNVLTLRPGEKVTLRFKNGDPIEHEFMAGRAPSPGRGYGQDLFKGVETLPKPAADHGMGHGDLVAVRVKPGQSAIMTFVVPAAAGPYEFGCFIEGHYEAGMKGALTIFGAGAPDATAGGGIATGRPPGAPASPGATMGSDMEDMGH